MEWLVQYCSLGFDQRQEKSQKSQSQTAGGQVCHGGETGRGNERKEWVKEEETGGKVPIWQRGQSVNGIHF